jgi:hypothetical protein
VLARIGDAAVVRPWTAALNRGLSQACADQQVERATALGHRGQRGAVVAVGERLVEQLLGAAAQAFHLEQAAFGTEREHGEMRLDELVGQAALAVAMHRGRRQPVLPSPVAQGLLAGHQSAIETSTVRRAAHPAHQDHARKGGTTRDIAEHPREPSVRIGPIRSEGERIGLDAATDEDLLDGVDANYCEPHARAMKARLEE